MKKFITAEEDDQGNVTKGIEIYVNPANISYCEACGESTYIYFIDGVQAVRVYGKARDVVFALERK